MTLKKLDVPVELTNSPKAGKPVSRSEWFELRPEYMGFSPPSLPLQRWFTTFLML